MQNYLKITFPTYEVPYFSFIVDSSLIVRNTYYNGFKIMRSVNKNFVRLTKENLSQFLKDFEILSKMPNNTLGYEKFNKIYIKLAHKYNLKFYTFNKDYITINADAMRDLAHYNYGIMLDQFSKLLNECSKNFPKNQAK